MASAGDCYVIELKKAHLEWGTHRHTSTRGVVYGEGYIPIPSKAAYRFNIYNSNNSGVGLGFNLFNWVSSDGELSGLLKSAGNQSDARYAKQFHGNGDLKALGTWFFHCNAQVGDHVEVRWDSPTDITITHL